MSETRREEIETMPRRYRLICEMVTGALFMVIAVQIGAVLLNVDDIDVKSMDYRMNLVTEGMGILATVFIINRWYAHRDRERQREQAQLEEERQTDELKKQLVEAAGSTVNSKALSAIEQLRHKGWLEGDDGLLQGQTKTLNHANWNNARNNARLDRVNLQNTSLVGAELNSAEMIRTELQKATLSFAKMHCVFALGAYFQDSTLCNAELIKANLTMAQFQCAKLIKANLEEAFMPYANLQGADLTKVNMKNTRLHWDVNLQGANLSEAKLENAIIWQANLRGANLRGSNIQDANLAEIVLPNDDTYADDRDLDKFTNPSHPDFPAALKKINLIRQEMNLDPIPSPPSE